MNECNANWPLLCLAMLQEQCRCCCGGGGGCCCCGCGGDAVRCDVRIKSQKPECNGKAEPKEPQYQEKETLERKSLA